MMHGFQMMEIWTKTAGRGRSRILILMRMHLRPGNNAKKIEPTKD